MGRKGREIKVELETLASHFIVHKHSKNEVDEVICIKKDTELEVPIREVNDLEFIGGKSIVSVTLDKSTIQILDSLTKRGFRSRSHAAEYAIIQLNELKKLEENK